MKIAKLTYNSSTGATAISGDTLSLYDDVELEIEGLTTEQMSGLVFEISTKSYVALLRTRGFADSKKVFTLNSRALAESFTMINPSGAREFFAVGRDTMGECLFTGVMQIKNRTDYPTYIYESIAEHDTSAAAHGDIRTLIENITVGSIDAYTKAESDGKYAVIGHVHMEYVTENALSTALSGYALANHNHAGVYANASHTHADYAIATHNHDAAYSALNHTHDYSTTYAALGHTHSNYALTGHTHDYTAVFASIDHSHSGYSLTTHNHDSAYAAISHTHSWYALSTHNHDGTYVPVTTGYSLVADTEITRLASVSNYDDTAITAALSGKADISALSDYSLTTHNHDGVYAAISHTHDYTSVFSAIDHNHDDDYVAKITGKGLSTEDYTSDEKTKLSTIAEGAEVNVNADWNATSGDAQILNKPTIPDAQIQADWTQTTDTAKDYIKNKPSIPANSSFTLAGLSEKSYNNLTDKPTIPAAQVQPDWSAVSGMGQILNKPTIPSKTSDLTNDSDFTTASAVSSGYVAKDGSKVLSDNNYDSTSKTKLDGLANITTIGANLTLTDGTLAAGAASGADTNLSNVTATGKTTAVGWGMPDTTRGATKVAGTLYQATVDLWVYAYMTGTAGGGINVYSDSAGTLDVYNMAIGASISKYLICPIPAGLYYKATSGFTIKVYPCRGSGDIS